MKFTPLSSSTFSPTFSPGTATAPAGIRALTPSAAASSNTDVPSGVGSASDDSAAASATCRASTPGIRTNALARRLP